MMSLEEFKDALGVEMVSQLTEDELEDMLVIFDRFADIAFDIWNTNQELK